MIKEAIICAIIIVAIFSLDIFTQNFTKATVNEITDKLDSVGKAIQEENIDKINFEVNELDKSWNNKHDKMAYYIEHDELEKVDVSIIKLKSYIETEYFDEAMAQIEEGKFILEHIQEKNAFNLQNIF